MINNYSNVTVKYQNKRLGHKNIKGYDLEITILELKANDHLADSKTILSLK